MNDFSIGVITIVVYIAPLLIGYWRGHRSKHAIAFVNIALGWTVLGWFWAMVWALSGERRAQSV